MKTLILISALLVSAQAFSSESRLVCTGVECRKETRVHDVSNSRELKMTDITPNVCLIDLKNNITSKVLETDEKKLKIVLVTEDQTGNLKRTVTYYDKRDFDRMQRVIPCVDTDTVVLKDLAKTQACLKTSGPYAQKYFCEKERRKNF